MMQGVRKGAQLIVPDPREIGLTRNAALWLRHRPGNDAALINALCHVILREGLEDADFIAQRTKGIDPLRELCPAARRSGL